MHRSGKRISDTVNAFASLDLYHFSSLQQESKMSVFKQSVFVALCSHYWPYTLFCVSVNSPFKRGDPNTEEGAGHDDGRTEE